MERCHECGEPGRLIGGVCAWRAGCEHRQMVTEARMADLDRFLGPTVGLSVPPTSCDLHVDALLEVVFRHMAEATREAHERGLLPPDAEFQVPEITFDDEG